MYYFKIIGMYYTVIQLIVCPKWEVESMVKYMVYDPLIEEVMKLGGYKKGVEHE